MSKNSHSTQHQNDHKKFNDKIEDIKNYSTQIKELKDAMTGCDDDEILAELKVTLDLLKKQWRKTNESIRGMSQDSNTSSTTISTYSTHSNNTNNGIESNEIEEESKESIDKN